MRRECVADDLVHRYPAGVRAGLDAGVREPLHAAYAEYRDAVAIRYAHLRRLADRAVELARGRLLREVAEALSVEADALVGYVLALALGAPAGEWAAARDAWTAAVAARLAAEVAAGVPAGNVRVGRAWTRLLAAAHTVALAALSPVPAAAAGVVGQVTA